MSGRTLRWVIAVTVLASALLLAVPSLLGPVGQLALGVPLVLVFPGYVVFRLLFPTEDVDSSRFTEMGPFEDGTEQPVVAAAIAVGFSVVLVPIVARVLLATVGFSRATLVATIGTLVVLGGLLAIRREPAATTPEASVAHLARERVDATRSYVRRDSMAGTLTGVLVVASLVFFLSSVAFAFTAAPAEESYTEFYLLTENETGDLVASEYPANLSTEEPTQLVAGIENHEGQPTTYAVVVEIQRVENGSILERQELDRFETRLDHDESVHLTHGVTSPLVGDDLRLQYYLYRGDAPATVSATTADETLHLDVSTAAG